LPTSAPEFLAGLVSMTLISAASILLHGSPDVLPPCFPMPIDFAQNDVATSFRGRNHSIDPVDVVQFERKQSGG
jgi:hypothetical protein